jgi:hypothetical protein
MVIGPVSVIRSIPSVRPSSLGSDLNPDLTGIFAAEFRDQQRDDSYSPSRKASRGLEDEDDDTELIEPESASELQIAASSSAISFFA